MTETPAPPPPGTTPPTEREDVAHGGTPPTSDDDVQPLEPPDPVQEEPEPPDPVQEEPEPFADGPPPLPTPMLVLDGELPDEPSPAPVVPVDHGTCRCGGAFDADGYCTECGERKPDPRDHFSARATARVAAVCDRGIRHTANEDAMAVWAEEADNPGDPGGLRAALVVCDGVSSAARSAEASLAAAYAALEVLTTSADEAEDRLARATDAAAAAVVEVADEFPDSAPSCTFVAAVVEGRTASVGNVGDSRAYWLPVVGESRRLTRDDSIAEEQVEAGVDRAAAEAGPLAHTITRWLGPDAPDHTPEVLTLDVSAPGWLLLCSDGLWNYASEPRALHDVILAEQERVGEDPLALAEALVGWANAQGGADNITVALVRTGQAEESGTADAGQDGTHG